MAVLDFKRSTTTPSTLAKGTLQFVKVGSRFKMLVGDNANSPTEANYLPFEGGTLTGGLTLDTNIASPLILTRSGGDVGINMNGSYLGVSNGVLRFGTSSTHANNNEVWHSGNLTQASINGWNAAYGWGDHAGKYVKTVTMLGNASIDAALESGIYRNENGLGGAWSYSPVLTLRSSDTGAQLAIDAFGGGMKFRGIRDISMPLFSEWNDVYHTGSPRITAPTIDATGALIIPNTAPTAPEANRTYLWIS